MHQYWSVLEVDLIAHLVEPTLKNQPTQASPKYLNCSGKTYTLFMALEESRRKEVEAGSAQMI